MRRAIVASSSRLPDTPEPDLKVAGRDGVSIAADTFGRPTDPAIVLLHGGGQTRHSWKSTGTRLAGNGFFVISFDARGHGDSDWSPAGKYDQDALISDLVSVVDAFGIEKPILAGASAGGATALASVGLRRVDARAIILIDVVPQTEPSGYERVRSFMLQNPDGFGSLEEAAETIASFRGSTGPRNLSSLGKNLRIMPNGRFRWHWDPLYLEARQRDLEGRYEKLSDYARSVSISTLLVRGGSSDVVSEEGAQEFLKLCPHAEYVNVKDAGHMLVGDKNDVFGSAAAPFLKRIQAEAATRII